MKRLLYLTFLLIFFCAPAWGATYYVKTRTTIDDATAASATGADCDNAKNLRWFNENAANDDTCVLCDGTYDDSYDLIYPGSTNDRTGQTYQADNQYGAVFDGSTWGAYLNEGDDNTTIDGIYFEQTTYSWIKLYGADNCIIKNCKFKDSDSSYGIQVGWWYPTTYESYNTLIQDCIFEDVSVPDLDNYDGVWYQVMASKGARLKITDCSFGNSRHGTFEGGGDASFNYVVIRDCVFKNELHHNVGQVPDYTLVENCSIYDNSLQYQVSFPDETKDAAACYTSGSYHCIWRNNRIWNNCYAVFGGGDHDYSHAATSLYVYHNTLYNNWIGIALNSSNEGYYHSNYNFINNIFFLDENVTDPQMVSTDNVFVTATEDAGGAVHCVSGANYAGQSTYDPTNTYAYNIFYGRSGYYYYPNTGTNEQSLTSLESTETEWHDNIQSNPRFTNASSDDFTLQSTSPAIDAATYLTLTNGTGSSSTTLIVDDAGYFYDGWSITGETADTIYVNATTPFSVQISSINYSTNTITLSSAQTWEDNVEVYHCPNGVCFSGSAPDIGANEHTGYYVTQDGAGGETGADCANAKSLAWFNSNGADGDTCVLCDDTYTTTISPANPNQTYEADNQYGAVFNGTSSYGAVLGEVDDNITLDGIYFYNTGDKWIYIAGADRTTIKNCKFYIAHSYQGITIGYNASYPSTDTIIQDCVFEDGESSTDSPDMPSDMIRLEDSTRTLIKNNTFGNARHACVSAAYTQTEYLVVRDNQFKNEWHAAGGTSYCNYGLFQNNTVYDAAVNGNPYSAETKENLGVSTYPSTNAILRYNEIWDCEYGILSGTSISNSENVYIYHNTLYNNYVQFALSNSSSSTYYFTNYRLLNNIFAFDSLATWPDEDKSIDVNCFENSYLDAEGEIHVSVCALGSAETSARLATNKFYNNLFYDRLDYLYYNTSSVQQSLTSLESVYSSVWYDNIQSNPRFTNASSDDFTLQSTSPAIDAATPLTYTDGSGNASQTLYVDDAGYFYDGWSISGETSDTIYVDAATPFTVRISSIIYETNKISIASAQTWQDECAVYLCPGGVCFNGSAPDIGANEYTGTPQNHAPVITQVEPGDTDLYVSDSLTITISSVITDEDSDSIDNIIWDAGIEYMTDWNMETDPTNNWTASNATLAEETTTKYAGSKSLKVTDNGSFANAYQIFSAVNGREYTADAYVYIPSTNGVTACTVMVGDAVNGYEEGYTTNYTVGAWTNISVKFTASATETLYVALNVNGDIGDWAFVDNFRVRQTETDTTGGAAPFTNTAGTLIYPDPGSYPTEYTVTVNAEDEHGEAATEQSFTITINSGSEPASTNVFTGDSDCIAHYKMDDATDEIGNDDLTESGDPTFTGGAVVLDGDDCLYDNSFSNDIDGSFTIFAKFHFDAELGDNSFAGIAGEWDSTNNKRHWALYVLDDSGGGSEDEANFSIGHTSGEQAYNLKDTSFDLVHDTDYNIIATYDNTNDDAHLYTYNADGTTKHNTDPAPSDWTNDISYGEDPGLGVGDLTDPTIPLTGSIHEVAIIKRECTENEAQAMASGQFPLAIIAEFTAVNTDGTYGIDDVITVEAVFKQYNGSSYDPIAVTWTDGGTDSTLTAALDAGDDLTLTHSYPASGTASSTHQWQGTIVAGQTEADLDITAFNLEDGTFTYGSPAINCNVSLPTSPNRLQDNAAIVIDTTGIDFSAGSFFHCNSSGTQINDETTYTTGETCYLCVESNGDNILFVDGPTSNLKIGTDSTYPDKEEWEYYSGIGTTTLIFYRTIQAGDRDLDLQAEGTAEGTGFIHGATKVIDSAENEATYTLPQVDPDGGNIIIAAPATFTIGTSGDFTNYNNLIANIYSLPGDENQYSQNISETIDTNVSGTSSNPITLNGDGYTLTGNCTIDENYWTLEKIIHASTVLLSGTGNTHEMSIVPSGSTLQITGTSCIITNDTIKGTLDIDSNVSIRNTAVPGTVSLANGITMTANYCRFAQTEAQIEAGGGTVIGGNNLFNINDFGFTDEAGGDFSLTNDSLLKNTGHDYSQDYDIIGVSIPQGLGPDIGAYEYSYQYYFYGDHETLPSGTTVDNLNLFSSPDDYIYVQADDNTYVSTTATDEYAIFVWKDLNDNNTDSIKVRYKGKSSVSTSIQPVYLQIYNNDSSTWVQFDVDNSTTAGVEFELIGIVVGSSVEDYYVVGDDYGYWIICRVYQHSN